MGRIIANMVIRNEADHYLDAVLERLSEQVDEIVITDDASTDNSVEIAAKYTNKINVLEEPTFKVHEGRLRQASWNFLEAATTPTTDDWILAIDADEFLYEDEPGLMRTHISQPHLDVISIAFFHMWSPTHFRTDGGWHPHGSTRLFRYEHGGTFKDAALACGSEPQYVFWRVVNFRNAYLIDSGLRMQHLSYIKDEDKLAKYERYSTLDGGQFHAGSHIQSIIDPLEQVSLHPWSN